MTAPAMPPGSSLHDRTTGHRSRIVFGIEFERRAGIGDDGAGYCSAVARAEKSTQTALGRTCGIRRCQFNGTADFLADADCHGLKRCLHGIGSVDTLGDCARKFLGFVTVRQ